MPTPTAHNTGSAVSGSIQQNNISYVVDGQNRNYRDGFGGLNWISEAPPSNNLVFVGNTTSIGRGPAGFPVFYPTLSTSSEDILNTLNKLPGSPGNFENTGSGYVWALNNNFFINNANQPFGGIVADGLVLYLDAGKVTSYPTTSSTWYDLSGNNNGVLTNGPTFNSNGWIEFDGVDDHITIPSPGSFSNYTISFFTKWISTISQGRLFGTNASGTYTIRDSSNVNFHYNPLGGSPPSVSLSSNTNVGLNRWTQVTVTVNSTDISVRIYINGLLKNSNSIIPSVNLQSTIFIGSGPSSQGLFSNCTFGSAYIYNKPLSQQEILQNYYQSPIVTSGLVLAVDAGNLVSYESGSATTYQLTGSVNSGSLNNGVTFSPNAGGTWGFDGTDDFINFGNSTPINFIYTDPFSLEAWFNPNALSGFKHIIGKTFGNYRLAQNGNAISFRLDSNKMIFQTGAVLTVGKWTHVIATWEPSTFTGQIYVDGILAATSINTNINWTNTTANFQIGNSPGENYYFNGNIALGRAYNRTLSPSEISQNFNAQRSRFGI